MNRLKNKWKITSNWQFLVILFIFSITGSSTLIARRYIFEWMGISAETNLWVTIPLYLLIIFPVYQLLFLFFGAIFGQFRFVWEFEKKMLSRFNCRR
ncbi:MAG: diacylglyceryl transferase [Bacteroidetes bacterium]|nr:MAG: diacylglyceryl transferase [Bacteroidota bacterium]